MNDKKAALALAQLHAARLLPVRDLRALVEQRRKHVNLITSVKNRLHSVLHRHDVQPPAGMDFFAEDGDLIPHERVDCEVPVNSA